MARVFDVGCALHTPPLDGCKAKPINSAGATAADPAADAADNFEQCPIALPICEVITPELERNTVCESPLHEYEPESLVGIGPVQMAEVVPPHCPATEPLTSNAEPTSAIVTDVKQQQSAWLQPRGVYD